MTQPLQLDSIRAAGYARLVQEHGLAVLPNWHESAVAAGNTHRVEHVQGLIRECFPSAYWPGDSLGDHLEFALKYDGVNLQNNGRLSNRKRADHFAQLADEEVRQMEAAVQREYHTAADG